MRTWTALRLLFNFANKAKSMWKQKVRSSTEADVVWNREVLISMVLRMSFWSFLSVHYLPFLICFPSWSLFSCTYFSDSVSLNCVFGVRKVYTVFPLEDLRNRFLSPTYLWRPGALNVAFWFWCGDFLVHVSPAGPPALFCVCSQQECLSSWLVMQRSSSFSVCGRVLHSWLTSYVLGPKERQNINL